MAERDPLEDPVHFVEERTAAAPLLRGALRYLFPDHWSFLLGEVALYSFIVLIATGIYLALFFDPSTAKTVYHGPYAPLDGRTMSAAYKSVLDISFQYKAGLLIRQTHHWAADVFVASIVVHLMRVFFTGAFRKPRELTWLIGLLMLFVALLEGYLGYSIVDDLLSGMGLAIGYSVALLFAVAAVLFLLGGLVQINPIWQWGPYEPWLGTNGAQPDWYLGWLIGALRLIPSFDLAIGHYTLVPNPFWGGALFPLVVLLVLAAFPWIERRLTRDYRVHNLLDRPRDAPNRTAFGVAFLTWVFLVFAFDEALAKFRLAGEADEQPGEREQRDDAALGEHDRARNPLIRERRHAGETIRTRVVGVEGVPRPDEQVAEHRPGGAHRQRVDRFPPVAEPGGPRERLDHCGPHQRPEGEEADVLERVHVVVVQSSLVENR